MSTVELNIARPFKLRLDDGEEVSFVAGVQDVPAALADHWYVIENLVPPPAPEPEPAPVADDGALSAALAAVKAAEDAKAEAEAKAAEAVKAAEDAKALAEAALAENAAKDQQIADLKAQIDTAKKGK